MYTAKTIENMPNAEAIQRKANKIAKEAGHGMATKIVIGTANRVIDHINYGYRKISTDEYVPNAYRNNFGWKNTYYQPAETTVEIIL
ncbi:MAG: hypothetical protein ACREBY_18335 [Polaromonas sp.]